MKTRILIALLLSLLIYQTGCDKDDGDHWAYCDGCTIESWVGEFNGDGEFYNSKTGKLEEGIPTTVSIENSSDNILKISIVGVDYYSGTFTQIKDDDSYSLEVAGSSQSLSLTLSQKSDAFKLAGGIKGYHYVPDSNDNDSLVMDYTMSFEVYRDL